MTLFITENLVAEGNTIYAKQPIDPGDPGDPDGIKPTHNVIILLCNFIDDVLIHELQFSQLQIKMNLDTLIQHKVVYEAIVAPSLHSTCRQACLKGV